LFRSKQRTAAAWAKGLMLGKAVGARDERERIIAGLEANYLEVLESLGMEWNLQEMEKADILAEMLQRIRGQKND
jgi:hypothetical protein